MRPGIWASAAWCIVWLKPGTFARLCTRILELYGDKEEQIVLRYEGRKCPMKDFIVIHSFANPINNCCLSFFRSCYLE